MLKEKRYEEGDIVTLVLTGGQELLGKFVSESGDYFIIKKPLTLMYGQKISFQPNNLASILIEEILNIGFTVVFASFHTSILNKMYRLEPISKQKFQSTSGLSLTH